MSAATFAGARQEWLACRAIAMQAYHKRRGQGSIWLSKALWVLALLGSALAGLLTGKWMVSFGIGLGIGSALLSFLWWSLLVASVTQQNFPVAYYLVPGMRGRSLAVLAGSALLIVLVHVLLFAIGGIAPALTAAIAVAVLASVAAAMLLRSVQLLCSAWTLGYLLFGLQTPAAFDGWVAQHYLVATAVLLLAFVLLAKLEWRVRDARAVAATPASRQKAAGMYAWRLRRDCEQGNVGYLLLHACGPGSFASMAAPGLLLLFLCAAVARPFLDAHSIWITIIKAFLVAFTISDHVRVVRRVSAEMAKRQATQALVRLCAGAPDASLFNRTLGQVLLREFGLYWGATSGAVLLFMAAGGTDGVRLLGLGAVYVVSLAFGAFFLRDYAQAIPERSGARLIMLCYPVAGGALAWYVLRGGITMSMAMTMLAAAALAAASVLTLRAQAFARLPAAFPAARLNSAR